MVLFCRYCFRSMDRMEELQCQSREVDASLEKQRKLLDLEQRLSRLRSKSEDTSAIPEVMSEDVRATATSSVTKDRTSTAASIPSEYLQDTFESAVPTTSFTQSNLLSHEIATSTPLSGRVTAGGEISEAGKSVFLSVFFFFLSAC